MKRGKIVLFALTKDLNIGDPIIGETALYICRNILPDADFELIDLKGRYGRKSPFFALNFPFAVVRKVSSSLGLDSLVKKTNDIIFNNFLRLSLRNCRFILFAGGGVIETEHYFCDYYISRITEFAERRKIRIAYNAVGFNGDYDESKAGYRNLKKALHSRQVVSVTVRENLDEMKNRYGVDAALVSDTAVWASDAYGISKDPGSKLIGVNVIRPGVFEEFGIDFSHSDLLGFYVRLIAGLESAGHDWQLFTNGTPADEVFADELIAALGVSSDKKAERPVTGSSLVSIISRYRAVFCTRMHASICSYSLKIPTVALLWNQKQKSFYGNTGHPDALFEVGDIDYEKIVASMERQMDAPWDDVHYDAFRMLVWNSLENVLSLVKNDL